MQDKNVIYAFPVGQFTSSNCPISANPDSSCSTRTQQCIPLGICLLKTVNHLGRRLANLSFRRNSIHGFTDNQKMALVSTKHRKFVKLTQNVSFYPPVLGSCTVSTFSGCSGSLADSSNTISPVVALSKAGFSDKAVSNSDS